MGKKTTLEELHMAKKITESEIDDCYKNAKAKHPDFNFDDLDSIFKIAKEDMSLFPGSCKETKQGEYFQKWVNRYVKAINKPPHENEAKPKAACSDPGIAIIVQATQDLDKEEVEESERQHNLFMSAENIQGGLLEEYIAENVRPYGFLWCAGQVLRAVDFCNTEGTFLLQVKNKDNTENSSSSNIRAGTDIEKWNRLKTEGKRDSPVPGFRWKKLNKLINDNRTEGGKLPPCEMSEEDYENFLWHCAGENPKIVTDQ